jgi:hypothetical protein
MATIRKHREKWQVQIRRAGLKPLSKSFTVRKDALEWARHTERLADRQELPTDPKALQKLTLGDLVRRYRDTVSPRKKTGHTEQIVLNAILAHPICLKRLSELRTEDFAEYRDQRLQKLKPVSLKRELVPIRHLFQIAPESAGSALRANPPYALAVRLVDYDMTISGRIKISQYMIARRTRIPEICKATISQKSSGFSHLDSTPPKPTCISIDRRLPNKMNDSKANTIVGTNKINIIPIGRFS